MSSLRLVSSISFALVLVACGGETKPAAADAKSPDKAAPTPVADKGDAAKPADGGTKVIQGGDPVDDRYTLRVDPPADAVAGRIAPTPKTPGAVGPGSRERSR